MATFNQKDIELLEIGGTANLSTTNGINTLNDGEIGIFTPSGTRMTAALAATAESFIIAQGRGSDVPVISGIIKTSSLLSAEKQLFVPATQVLEYIGYNGTAGAIDVITDNLYEIDLNIAQHVTSNHGGLYVKSGFYQTGASATQEEVAQQLVISLINNFSKEPERQVKFERVNSGAGAATTGATGTITFTCGSRFAQASVSATAEITAGDYLRVGNTTDSPVYKAVSVSGTVIELDVVYQGTSGTEAIGAVEVIPLATANAGDYGLKLTGLSLKFVVGKINYKISRWKTGLGSFGTTLYTRVSGANEGSGTVDQISEQEWFLQGNEGEIFRMGEPNIFSEQRRRDTDPNVAGGGYDQINISIKEVSRSSIVMGPISKLYTLAIPATTPQYADSGEADGITNVLDVLLGLPSGTLDLN